jgi:hypothetical protein
MPQYTRGYEKDCPQSTYTYFEIRLVISEILWIGPEKNPKSSFANQTPFIQLSRNDFISWTLSDPVVLRIAYYIAK